MIIDTLRHWRRWPAEHFVDSGCERRRALRASPLLAPSTPVEVIEALAEHSETAGDRHDEGQAGAIDGA
jgi:hypothetical protein